MISLRQSALLGALLLWPAAGWSQAATATSGSAACATLATASANGMLARIKADDSSIPQPASVKSLSCLDSVIFSNGSLNVLTSLFDPSKLLDSLQTQLCSAVTNAWQSVLNSTKCGLTVTGFNIGFDAGSLGGGSLCPNLSFGGGGPPLASVGVSAGTSAYMNSAPMTPAGYTPVETLGAGSF